MRIFVAGLTTLALWSTAVTSARAQARSIELGIDGALAVTLDEPRVTTIAIPFQQFRVGFFISPRTSIEPTLSIVHVSADTDGGDLDLTTISVGVGVLFHLTPSRTQSQVYFRPFAGFRSVSGDLGDDSGANVGLGVGLKSPIASRLSSRFEAFLAHDFDGETTSVGLLFGLSFFPR